MKLSEILGRILTDVALRQRHPGAGACELVDLLGEEHWRDFRDAREACSQTGSYVFPVLPASGPSKRGHNGPAARAFDDACFSRTMWRGKYGINRRKLVRDCWRWAKERGL